MSLFLTAALSIPAFAADTKFQPDLMGAIVNLSHRVEVLNRSPYVGAQRLGRGVFLSALAVGTGVRWLGGADAVFRFAISGAQISAFVWALGAISPIIYLRVKGRDPQAMRTVDGLNAFFALPVAMQYETALKDPELAQFVIQLNQSYEDIDQTMPGSPAVASGSK